MACCIRTRYKPARGRELKVVVLNTSSNIKDWVDSLPINISGLVPNPRQADGKGMDVCHAWRIARREEI